MKTCLRSLAGMILLFAFTGAESLSADWPQWRGPSRDGISPETTWSHSWRGEPKRAWKASVGVGFASVAVAGGSVYTQGNIGNTNIIWCLDAATGKVRWNFAHPESLMANQFEGGPTSTPLYVAGKVYTASRKGLVHCLDAATGAVVWKQSLPALTELKMRNWGLNSSPLMVGGRLILNWGTAGVALDSTDGRLLWLSGKDEWSYTSAVPGKWNGREVLFVSAAEQLAAVGLDDGVIRWTEPFHVGFKASDPVRFGNKVFFGANETGGALVSFENKTPAIAWNKSDLGTFTGGAVLVDGFLYAIVSNRNDKGALTCIDPATGTVQWSKGGFGWGSLLAAGDRLIVLSVRGELTVAQATPKKFENLASAQVLGGKCWTMPALADGHLFVRNGKGDLACLDLRTTKVLGKLNTANLPTPSPRL